MPTLDENEHAVRIAARKVYAGLAEGYSEKFCGLAMGVELRRAGHSAN